MQVSARSLFLSLLLAAGCDLDIAGDNDAGGDAIGESAEGLYANLNFTWSGNPVFIPVCWENPSAGSVNAPTFSVSEATTRGWVRDAIEGQWSRYGRVNFTQWDTCTSGEPGIHIQIIKTGVSSAPGGSTLNGVNNGVKLNQYYNDRADCQSSLANLQRCVQAVGLHEFGHVLGFYHEEERPDYPGGTGPCAKQTFPNANPQFYGAYDINSVMSYCGQPANDISTWKMAISPGDIAAVQKAYGRRKPGQFAAARGADMLANNNAIDNKAFIWDADEAAGQLWSYDFASQVFRVTANGLTSCLDTYPSATSGQQLTANQCFLDSFQRFPLNNLFLRGFGGLCLDLPGGNTANGTPLQVWQCGALGGNNQRWSIDTSRRIHFGATSKCVTAVATTGAALFLWDCGAAPYANNQAFTFATDGSLKLAASPASCADVQGPTTAQYLAGQGVPGNGAAVQTFTCVADQLNQKWNLSGSFRHDGGLCIDVASASNNNGTPVQVFTCNGTIAQDWDYYWK